MNKSTALLAAIFLPALMRAQTDASKPAQVTKIIRLHYASPHTVAELLNPGNAALLVGDNGLKAIVIRGPAADVARTEQAVRELDTLPPGESKNIEVTIYVIGATAKSESQVAMSRDIEPVVKQLEGVFPYKSYELLDTMLVRSQEGRQASTKGMMRSLSNSPAPEASRRYSIIYNTDPGSTEDNRRSIRFPRFQFETERTDVGFDTDFDVREGQKVVLGKTNVDDGESALFVVLSARVID